MMQTAIEYRDVKFIFTDMLYVFRHTLHWYNSKPELRSRIGD